MRLLDSLEVIAREKRLKVARAILYMAQGQSTLLYTVSTLNYLKNEILQEVALIENVICFFSRDLCRLQL